MPSDGSTVLGLCCYLPALIFFLVWMAGRKPRRKPRVYPNGRTAIPRPLREYVMKRDGYKCVYCGEKRGQLHLDHVVPYSQGGPDSANNLVVACKWCNITKGARTPQQAGMTLYSRRWKRS